MENRLTNSVGLIAISTGTTCPAGIARIDFYYRDTEACRLILDFRCQVVERPIAELPAHLLVKTVTSISDARKLLNRQCLLQFKCRLYERLTDAVVYILAETRDALTNGLQPFIGRARTARLNMSLMLLVPTTNGLDYSTREGLAFTISRNFNNAHVNSENTPASIGGRSIRRFDADRKVIIAVDEQKVGLAGGSGKKLFALLASMRKREGMSALRSGQTNGRHALQGHAPSVIDNGTSFSERMQCRTIRFVTVSDLSNGTDGELRGKSELRANSVIEALVQIERTKVASLPCLLRNAVTSGVEALHRIRERGGGHITSTQFALNSLHKHTRIIPQTKGHGNQSLRQ